MSEALEEYVPEEKPVATFWRQATQGTYYWRLLIPARRLPGKVNTLRFGDIRHPNPLERQEGPAAIWQFLGDLERTRFVASVQERGVRCLMEVDDNYLIPGVTAPGARRAWTATIRQSWGKHGYSHQAHRLILPSIDGLIVSTDELANQYDGLVPAGIYVCPNSIEPGDWPEVERTDRNLVVGYAGSDSHYYDMALVERALDWAWRDGATLMKIGIAQHEWRWPHQTLPWTDELSEYRKNIQSIDVGLCPLKRSSWHDCKSDIKAMEYLMAGALPIVQGDSPVYSDWFDLVPTASTPKQWERVLREVIAMSPDERLSMWKRAHDWLMEHKTIEKHVHKWRTAINGRREMGRGRPDQQAREIQGVARGMEAAA